MPAYVKYEPKPSACKSPIFVTSLTNVVTTVGSRELEMSVSEGSVGTDSVFNFVSNKKVRKSSARK